MGAVAPGAVALFFSSGTFFSIGIDATQSSGFVFRCELRLAGGAGWSLRILWRFDIWRAAPIACRERACRLRMRWIASGPAVRRAPWIRWVSRPILGEIAVARMVAARSWG